MPRFQRFTTVVAALFVAAPLAAQGTTQNVTAIDSVAVTAVAPAPIVERTVVGPTQANAAVGIRANVATTSNTPLAPQGDVGRNPAMMIVGGAALIVGAIVGGDSGTVIMIGGGLLGLYGLWQYLK